MAIDIDKFSFLSTSSVDNIMYFQEASISVSGVANAPYYAAQTKQVDVDVDGHLFPILSVSIDGNSWFDITSPPQTLINSTVASGYAAVVSGGVISTPGHLRLIMNVPAQFNGTLYYRIWGTDI